MRIQKVYGKQSERLSLNMSDKLTNGADLNDDQEPPTKRQRSSTKSSLKRAQPYESNESDIFKVPNKTVSKRKCNKQINGFKNQDDQLNAGKKLQKCLSSYSMNIDDDQIDDKLKDNLSYLIKFQPKCKTDLCIDKRKLSLIEEWFESVFVNQDKSCKRILVLHGPTGCGKTSTVLCLARHYNVKLYEFEEKTQTYTRNKDELEYTQYVGKQIDQMKNFVTSVNSWLSKKERDMRKLIVIKDMPSTFVKQIDEFHQFLRVYLSFFRRGAPFIFIVTTNDEMNSNLFKKLFPVEQHQTLSLHFIEFTSVNKRLMRCALEKINIGGVASKSDIEMLIELSEGDIRSAINALEFIIESEKNIDEFEIHAHRSRADSCTNRLMAIKDTSPTFFHMLGKIMYCKREGDDKTTVSTASKKKKSLEKVLDSSFDFDDSFDSDLKLIAQCSNSRRRLKENPENLVNQIDSTGETLTFFIHESYLNFVDNDLESAAAIVHNLSFIDSHFSSQHDNNWQYDELDDYMKLLAVRGTMYNLNTTKEPVKIKRLFKPFSRPKLYSIIQEQEEFQNKIDDRMIKYSQIDCNLAGQCVRPRSRDELMDILHYKERHELFVKLFR